MLRLFQFNNETKILVEVLAMLNLYEKYICINIFVISIRN
ncbi:hypothetical protein FDUTEX481_07468 [Tolypothrix sp. PCC 7601]|nr:hypothetical protein FDUTEX481_07468 [Tolypothrix sp. PCC 7601]